MSVRETGVAASCAALSPAAQFAGARRVFVGEMLPGPTARMGGRQVLASPARMRVARYLKGHGPRTVTVETAVTVDRHGITVAEDGIEPWAGERWKIFTNSRHQPFDTSICAGSAPMRSAGNGKRNVRAALAPCDASYAAGAVAGRRAVAFRITTIAVPGPPGLACTAIGYRRTVVLHLARPLGARSWCRPPTGARSRSGPVLSTVADRGAGGRAAAPAWR